MSKRNLLKFADLCNISPIKERIQNILRAALRVTKAIFADALSRTT